MDSLIANRYLPLLLCLSSVLLPTCARSAESDSTLALFQAIDERLGYMEEVGLYKAKNQIPIEELERERIVLNDAKNRAASQGLDPESMETFFIAQINAAKAIQYRYRAQLLIQEIPTRNVDLQTGIRPALDQLGSDIIRLFAVLLSNEHLLNEQDRDLFLAAIQRNLLTDADKQALFSAMLEVKLAR